MTQAIRCTTALAGLAAAVLALPAAAQDYSISVWAGGSSEADSYRWEAIEMAADI